MTNTNLPDLPQESQQLSIFQSGSCWPLLEKPLRWWNSTGCTGAVARRNNRLMTEVTKAFHTSAEATYKSCEVLLSQTVRHQ